MAVNPKVHAGAASAGVGGSVLAVLLIWIMQDGLGMSELSFTAERVAAITGACAWATGYVGGYLKKA